MRLWVIIGMHLIPLFSLAQDNLVPNGDFNRTLLCTGNATIADWFVPQNDPVDIKNLCPYVDWWRFIRDRKVGINNSLCGFVETYYKGFPDDNINNGRSYLAVKLVKPLEAGKKYYIEMMVRSIDTFPNYKLVNTVFTDGQDISFTKELPLFDYILPRNFLPLRPVVRSVIKKNYEWYKVNHCFTADGNEQYLVIGNFRNDANTETASTGKTNANFPAGLIGNYAIDNVVLTPMDIPLADTSLCQGDTLRFDIGKPELPDLKYLWQNNSTKPYYQSTSSEQITLKMEYAPQCISEKQFRVIELNKSINTIQTLIDTSFCEGESLFISGGIHLSGQSIKWDDGNTTPVRVITSSGIYTSSIGNKCGLVITKKFNIKAEHCNIDIFIPNLFTPNEDGLNDEFKPILSSDFPAIESFSLSIFNRWGELIFVSHDPEAGWHGQHGSAKAMEGVYIYSLKIKTTNPGTSVITRSGDVTLIQN